MSYVEIKDVVKEYKTGEITIKAADGMNFSLKKENLLLLSDLQEQEKLPYLIF